jgi:hypothetical protein
MGDLTPDELMEIEGDVRALLRAVGLDDDEPPDLDRVCVFLTGAEPRLSPMRRKEGRTIRDMGARRIELRLGVLGTPRGRVVLGHECGHVYGEKFLRREVTEAWCDAFGAMLAAPRRATQLAIREVGHSPILLGEVLEVDAAAALLRIGEVSGRPVALERRPKVLVARGEPYPWPPVKAALRERLPEVHPVRVGERWGLMRRSA